MSGRKTTTIGTSEYERLTRAQSQLRSLRQHLPEELERRQRENAAELRRRIEPLEKRQRDYQDALNNVRSEVRDVERESARKLEQQQQRTQQALDQQQRQMQGQLEDTAKQLRQETQQLVRDQDQRLTNLIEEERRSREREVGRLQDQVDSIVADEERKRELAQDWVETAVTISEFIKSQYRHTQFAPGEVERRGREIQQARDNLSQGAAEAALSSAQRAYHALSDLRLELERLEQEWLLAHSDASERTRELHSLARGYRQCSLVEKEGDNSDVEIEVDWWTDGKLSQVDKDIADLLERINDDTAPLNTEELQKIVDVTIPDLGERLEEVVEEGKQAVISSQLRYETAARVVAALESQGFDLEDSTYEGEDMRNGYAAKLRNIEGSEVVVVLSPEKEGPQNTLQVHSYDAGQRSEHELRQRASELNQALKDEGYDIGELGDTGQEPDPRLRDVDRVRKQQPVSRRTEKT